MNRTANVVQMQLVNRNTFVWAPLMVLGGAFAVQMAIYGIIAYSVSDRTEPMYGGGVQAPLWYLAIVGVQAMTLSFPFSQAMSVTRREFYLGTLMTAAATAGVLALIVFAGGLLEGATDGWGFDGYFFRVPWIWSQGAVVAALLYFAAAFTVFVVGFLGATIYKRFGHVWLIALGLGLAALILLAAFLTTSVDGWPAVGRWLVSLKPLSVVGLCAALSVVLGGASYGILRRTIA